MNKTFGYVFVVLATTIWGSWSLVLRPTAQLGIVSPWATACWVQGITAVFLLPFLFWSRQKWWFLPRKVALLLFLSALCDACSVVLFFIAMRHATLALATLTHNMAPIFVSWIAPWWEKRPTNRSVWVGILLAIAGVGLVAYPANGWFIDFNYWGMAYGIASALMFAGHILFGKHLAKHLDSWVSLSWHRLIAALLLAPLAGYELFTLLPKQYMLLSAGGLVINGLAGWLFFTGIRYVSAEKVATLTLLEPVTAVVWGVLLWQESLSLLNFLGVVLVLTSVYVVIRANPSRQEGSLAENIFSPKDSAANCS